MNLRIQWVVPMIGDGALFGAHNLSHYIISILTNETITTNMF